MGDPVVRGLEKGEKRASSYFTNGDGSLSFASFWGKKGKLLNH
jgi:hypothetical protein